jgi:hypothetical protein
MPWCSLRPKNNDSYRALYNRLFDLLNLDFTESFDLEKSTASGGVHRLAELAGYSKCKTGVRRRCSIHLL